MNATAVFWKIEENRGSQRSPRWVWVASALHRHDAEQLMFRTFIARAARVISSDGKIAVYVPFGPAAPGEVERERAD